MRETADGWKCLHLLICSFCVLCCVVMCCVLGSREGPQESRGAHAQQMGGRAGEPHRQTDAKRERTVDGWEGGTYARVWC